MVAAGVSCCGRSGAARPARLAATGGLRRDRSARRPASPCWRRTRPAARALHGRRRHWRRSRADRVTVKLPSTPSSVVSLAATLTTPDASAREAPRRSMPRPSMVQVRAAWSKASVASPRNTATVGPNLTRIEPRHRPSPWSGASVAPGMHDATSAGSLSSGQTSSAGDGIVVVSVNDTMKGHPSPLRGGCPF